MQAHGRSYGDRWNWCEQAPCCCAHGTVRQLWDWEPDAGVMTQHEAQLLAAYEQAAAGEAADPLEEALGGAADDTDEEEETAEELVS